MLVLATATPGGGFPLYAGALAETVNETDPNLRIEPRNSKGSTENIDLLQRNQVDLAVVTGEVVDSFQGSVGLRAS